MKCLSHSRRAVLLQIGAGLIGRHLGPLLGSAPNVVCIRVMDRDVITEAQAWTPANVGRLKAKVVAESIQSADQKLRIEPIVGDIEHLPLGMFRCDVLLTALDSKRARMLANYAFRKLAIPYWIDSGVSAPSLVRISTFAQGPTAPCYECGLDDADYASEQSYPCQPKFTPPPTNSPAWLGSLAASLQAAECTKLLSGRFGPADLNRELIYDTCTHRLILTRLECRTTCRLDHGALNVRPLRQSPHGITLKEAFALGPRGSKSTSHTAGSFEVPGKLFVLELACPCGQRRPGLRLKGRIAAAALACPKCGGRMSPPGTGLTDALARDALSPRDLARPLSALGLQPADVIAVGEGRRFNFFELGSPSKDSHDR